MNSLDTSPVGRHGSIGVEVLPHDLRVEALPPEVQALIRQVDALGNRALSALTTNISDTDSADLQPVSVAPGNYL